MGPVVGTILLREAIRTAHLNGDSDATIAERFGITPATVGRHLNAVGIKRPRGGHRLPESDDPRVNAKRRSRRARYARKKAEREASE